MGPTWGPRGLLDRSKGCQIPLPRGSSAQIALRPLTCTPNRPQMHFKCTPNEPQVGVMLGSSWGRLGVILGSSWGHLGVILGSLWGHFGVILGSFWGHLGIILGSLWDQSGIILGSCWDHVGINLVSIWGHVGIVPSRPNGTVARTGRPPERPDSRQIGPARLAPARKPDWRSRQVGQNVRTARTPDR